MSRSSNDWHNKGEQDRSQGNGYDKPHGLFEDLTTWTSDGMMEIAQDNQQYDKGWRNTDSQIKGKT